MVSILKEIKPKNSWGEEKVRVFCNCTDPECYLDLTQMVEIDREKKEKMYQEEVAMAVGVGVWTKNVLERIWVAVKLLFGSTLYREGEVWVDKVQVEELIKALEKCKENMSKVVPLKEEEK